MKTPLLVRIAREETTVRNHIGTEASKSEAPESAAEVVMTHSTITRQMQDPTSDESSDR
jgi:hypothetical protein